MSDSREYITHTEPAGTVNVSVEVLCSIAALAACEIDGVRGLAQNRSADIAELLGYRSLSQGVRSHMQDDDYSVELNVVLEQGRQIPQIAAEVQKAVTSALESTAGIHVSAVNVNICSIALPKKNV